MFESTRGYSGFAVDDLENAREFYGETLGLPERRGFRLGRTPSSG